MYSGSNYPNGFKNGITIRGVPLSSTHPGEVYWFNSSSVVAKNGIAGSDGNDGSYHQPFGTLDGAVGKMKANRGDVLAIMPGSTVTISTAVAVAFDVAGIAIIGLGVGSLRPTLNFTAVDGTVTVSAANITLVNLLLTGGIDAVVAPITFSAADCAMIGCETRDVTGQAVDWIFATSAANRLLIEGHRHRGSSSAGADSMINIDGAEDCIVKGCDIDGDFAVAAIENATVDWVDAEISDCRIRNRASQKPCIQGFSDTASGWLGGSLDLRTNGGDKNTGLANTGGMQLMHRIETVYTDGASSELTEKGKLISGVGIEPFRI